MFKRYKVLMFFLLGLTSVYFVFWQTSDAQEIEIKKIPSSNNFVVVELFTSQGCSSCPPANRHFLNLKKQINRNNLPVYLLSFHVDYWNRLGWKDTFSDEKYTERQYRYARSFSNLNVYTPQIIINGAYEYVGSDEESCQQEIVRLLSSKVVPPYDVDAHCIINSDSLLVNYNVDDSFSGLINIALVQKEGMVHIKRGENAGVTLDYQNIVRNFKQIDSRKMTSKNIQIIKPHNLSPDNLEVIVYLQHKVDMQIVNAVKASIL